MKDYKISSAKPLWDNVLIKPIKLEKKDEYRRPQQEEDKSELGEIVAIGAGTDTVDITKYLKVGDVVLFNKYSSTSIDIGEEVIVRAEDIVAVLKK